MDYFPTMTIVFLWNGRNVTLYRNLDKFRSDRDRGSILLSSYVTYQFGFPEYRSLIQGRSGNGGCFKQLSLFISKSAQGQRTDWETDSCMMI